MLQFFIDQRFDELTPLQLSYKASILWHYPENDAKNPFQAEGINMVRLQKFDYFDRLYLLIEKILPKQKIITGRFLVFLVFLFVHSTFC